MRAPSDDDTKEIPVTVGSEQHRSIFVASLRRQEMARAVTRGLLGVGFVVLVGAVAAVGVVVVQNMTASPPIRRDGARAVPPVSSTPTNTPSASSATTASSSRSTTTTSSSTTTTSSPASGAGAAHITAVLPDAAGPGAVVVVHGSGLISANGIVVARVNGRATRTDCPSTSMCQVTIPPLSRQRGRVPITISTSGGTSNSLSFLYD